MIENNWLFIKLLFIEFLEGENYNKCIADLQNQTHFFAVHIIKSFSFYKSTVYKKSAMSLNIKPDDRRMSAQKNASAFGIWVRIFILGAPTLPPTIPVTQTLCIDVRKRLGHQISFYTLAKLNKYRGFKFYINVHRQVLFMWPLFLDWYFCKIN